MGSANVEIKRTARDFLDELDSLVSSVKSIEEENKDIKKLIGKIQKHFRLAKVIKNEKENTIEYHIIVPEKDWNNIADLDIYKSIALDFDVW